MNSTRLPEIPSSANQGNDAYVIFIRNSYESVRRFHARAIMQNAKHFVIRSMFWMRRYR